MKNLVPMAADEILAIEMNNSPINQLETRRKIKKPGANPWTAYLIVGGVIVGAAIAAYYFSKPKQYSYSLKPNENGESRTND